MENTSIKNYDSIRELFQTLDDYGMKAEKNTLQFIVDYVDNAEKKYEDLLIKMGEMNQEFQKIKNSNERSQTATIINDINTKINDGKKSLTDIKNSIIDIADKVIKDVKIKGKDALISAMKKIKVKDILQIFSNNFSSITNTADKGIDKLSNLANRSHESKEHLANFGRSVIGKETKEISSRDTDVGICAKIQDKLFKVMETSTKMYQKTNEMIEKFDGLENDMQIRKNNKSLSQRISSAKEKTIAQTKNNISIKDKKIELG